MGESKKTFDHDPIRLPWKKLSLLISPFKFCAGLQGGAQLLVSPMEHLNLQPQRPPLKSGFAFQLSWKGKVNGCQFLETFYTCRGSDTALFLRFHGDSAARCTTATTCECTAATFQAEECAHTRMCALLRWCFLVCVCFSMDRKTFNACATRPT